MQRISRAMLVIAAAAACGASTTALAANPLGFYLGAGLGYSTVRSDDPAFGLPGYFNNHQTAWKAIAGVRPIPIIGAEFEYLDFGQPGGHHNYNINYYGTDTHPRAAALFVLGYLPIPLPFLDIFAKAGAARLQTNVVTSIVYPVCVVTSPVCNPIVTRQETTNNRLAYGAGIQSKWIGVSVRAEYERISSRFGDPDAFTVSATYTF